MRTFVTIIAVCEIAALVATGLSIAFILFMEHLDRVSRDSRRSMPRAHWMHDDYEDFGGR